MRQTTTIIKIEDNEYQLLQVVEKDIEDGIHQKVIKHLDTCSTYTDALVNKLAADYLIEMDSDDSRDSEGFIIIKYEAMILELVNSILSKFSLRNKNWPEEANLIFNQAISRMQLRISL